jgi:nucleotide sugar dehydrogenase
MTTAPQRETCVVGLGYVGLPLAIALTDAGEHVVGFDVDAAKVDAMRAGRSRIEDISDEQLNRAVAAGLRLTSLPTEIKSATNYVICVPTPLRDGLPDLGAVQAAGAIVGAAIEPGDLVVLESTTYPGTTEDVLRPLLEDASGLVAHRDFDLAYSPERIDPGNETWTLHTTPKVVGGTTERATDRACELYGTVAAEVVRASGPRAAEMAKLLENTFRHVNIALVNELTVYAHALGIDIWEVIRLAGTKPFGFMPFYPGPGVGGHCIPVDPSYLSWAVRKHGFQFRFVELAQEVNERMPTYVVSRVTELLNEHGLAVSRSRILCVGVAYKPDVSDCRESPSLHVLRKLLALRADVDYLDPHVPEVTVEGRKLRSLDAPEGSYDLAVVLTAHSAVDLDAVAASSAVVFDTRNAAPGEANVVRL